MRILESLENTQDVRVARGALLPLFRALQISSVFNISTYARWRMNELLTAF